MRYMIMHKTNAHWESGALPDADLIARVGNMLGALAQSGALLAAEGLRPSSQGVRLKFAEHERTVVDGPFTESKELIGGFAILRVSSIQEAIEWSTKFARVIGDVEIDIRPVTEPWDLGMGQKPDGLTSRRFMATHRVPHADGCQPLTPAQMAGMSRLMEEMTRAGVLLSAEGLQPSSTGACIRVSGGKPVVMDGPFTESKEVLGGFVIVRADSRQQALEWARRYQADVGAEEVHVRLLAEPS